MGAVSALVMPFTIQTHDSWGVVRVGTFQQLEEAQRAFSELCSDPWYRLDGRVRGVELVRDGATPPERLAWFPFRG
jgi:hypothetical protein